MSIQQRISKMVKKARMECRTPLNSGTRPDPRAAERHWMVYSTALAELWLMLHCRNTGADGVVKDPTREEWSAAYGASSNPYQWLDHDRVTLMGERGER